MIVRTRVALPSKARWSAIVPRVMSSTTTGKRVERASRREKISLSFRCAILFSVQKTISEVDLSIKFAPIIVLNYRYYLNSLRAISPNFLHLRLINNGKITRKVSPTYEIDQQTPEEVSSTGGVTEAPLEPTSPLPTDEYGQRIVVGTTSPDQLLPYPTDSLGREIRPVVLYNGSALPTDASNNAYDPRGEVIPRDDEQRPLGPDGKVTHTLSNLRNLVTE